MKRSTKKKKLRVVICLTLGPVSSQDKGPL